MLLTREQVRAIDRRAIDQWGIPSLVLMENAGRGAADVLISLGMHGPVVVCCGKGNNGGDGLVLARHLALRDFPVKVLLFAQPADLSSEAAVHWKITQNLQINAEVLASGQEERLAQEFASAEWIVDALYGTGLTGAVRPPLDRVIQLINASPARVFAIDIPSGLDANSGEPLGATVRAHHTVTFVAAKTGFAAPAAAPWLGRVHVADIGAPIS